LSKLSLAEGAEFTHIWLLGYCTSSAEGRCFFHHREQTQTDGFFSIIRKFFCCVLQQIGVPKHRPLAPEHYSVRHTSTVYKEFGRLKTELLILRLYDAESIVALSPWHALSLRFYRTVIKALLDW